MSNSLDSFKLLLRQRRYSLRTVDSYLFWVRRLESHFPNRSIGSLRPTDVSAFFQHLQARAFSTESIRLATTAVRFFYRDILQKPTLANAVPSVKRISAQATIPTQSEIFAIISRVEAQTLSTMFKCIYGMGLELQEARTLRVRAVDLIGNKIRFTPQRSKTRREVPIPHIAIEGLKSLCAGRTSDSYLFSGQRGAPLSESTIQRAWRAARMAADAGVKTDIRSLRHAYIRHLELLGVRLVDVLSHLGIRKDRALAYYAAYSSSPSAITFSPADRILCDAAASDDANALPYVSEERLAQLAALHCSAFDFTRLLALLQELNSASRLSNLFCIAFLLRAIIDHVPPVLGFQTFNEVANSYAGTKSFKKSMEILNTSLRNVADGYLHTPIRVKEDLPHLPQVDFRGPLDQLLGELTRVLKTRRAS